MKKILLISFIFNMASLNTFPQWFLQNPYPTGNSLNAVKLISEDVGWAVGHAGAILKTNDGGASWESKTSEIKSELIDVSFINVNIGWVIGANGIILKTTNGGTNWTPQTSGVSHLSAKCLFC